jgi:hypothetical protein
LVKRLNVSEKTKKENCKMKSKRYFLIIFLLIGLSTFIACEQDDHILPKEDWFVAFESQSATISKNSPNDLRIPVYVAAGKGSSIRVDIGIKTDSTTAQAGVDYNFVRGPILNYPIGSGYDTLIIRPLSPGNPGPQRLWLFLESNSANYNMGFFHGPEKDSTSFADFVITFQ